MSNHSDWPNSIRVGDDDFGVFIHRANKAGELTGCYTCSLEEPQKNDWGTWQDTYFAPNTKKALETIRDLYNEADGGEGGGQLTGEKFLLKTNSTAKTDPINLKTKELSNLLEGMSSEEKKSN